MLEDMDESMRLTSRTIVLAVAAVLVMVVIVVVAMWILPNVTAPQGLNTQLPPLQ